MSEAEPQIGLRPLRLHHHAFVVKDMEVTRRFYEEVFGALVEGEPIEIDAELIAHWSSRPSGRAPVHLPYVVVGQIVANGFEIRAEPAGAGGAHRHALQAQAAVEPARDDEIDADEPELANRELAAEHERPRIERDERARGTQRLLHVARDADGERVLARLDRDVLRDRRAAAHAPRAELVLAGDHAPEREVALVVGCATRPAPRRRDVDPDATPAPRRRAPVRRTSRRDRR